MRTEKTLVITYILIVLIGIFMLVRPGTTITILLRILGIFLLIAGLRGIISYLRNREYRTALDSIRFAAALIIFLIGLVITARPGLIASFFTVLVGLILIGSGVLYLMQMRDMKQAGYLGWKRILLIGILDLLLGVLIVVNPFSAMSAAVVVIGFSFIYSGVSGLWVEYAKRKL